MSECIFCKIAKHEVKSDIVFEDEEFIAFYDIAPKAETHILVIPKEHITSVDELRKSDKKLVGDLMLTAQTVARMLKISEQGYKIVCNVGEGGGQIVPHIHLHLLSGKNIELP